MTLRQLLRSWLKRATRFYSGRDIGLFLFSKAVRVLRSWVVGPSRVVHLNVKPLHSALLCRLGTSDIEVLREIFLDDEYSGLDIVPGSGVRTILDLGAHIGLSLRFWADRFPYANLIGVEPYAENLILCRENCRLGGCLDRSVFVEACVGGASGFGWLSCEGEPWTFHLTGHPNAECRRVRVVTIGELIRDLQLECSIDILKCDIEGAEEQVMAGCSDWIDKVRIMIMELHGPYTLMRFMHDLEGTGRRFSIAARKGGALVVCQRLA